MPKNSEAIRLAEASDWKGLQRLIEKAPEFAHEIGDYGMLPIHWACTESHVPVALLSRLLAANPDGARIKNDAELLPLHIAIRARVESDWLEKLVDVHPGAVRILAPGGVTVLELADQVGLGVDGLKILHRAFELAPSDGETDSHHADDEDADESDHHRHLDGPEHDDHDDDNWARASHPLQRESVLAKVSPLLPRELALGKQAKSHGRSNGASHATSPDSPDNQVLQQQQEHDHHHLLQHTPVSPAHSSLSMSSPSESHRHSRSNNNSNSNDHLVSPSSSSSSSSVTSVNTAPIPRTVAPLHKQMAGPFQRKHSLDYHAHAAAAAAAARQHQEAMLLRGHHGLGHHGHAQPLPLSHSRTHGLPHPRTMSMLGGRHQSLPLIPSFEHVKFTLPLEHPDEFDASSEEDEDNNHAHSAMRRSSVRSGASKRRSGGGATGGSGRSFESPPEWKRDDECSICRASFGMFKHRHHCRNCGKSICSQHSADKKIAMAAKGFTTPQRVCVTCYAMITHKQQAHQFDAALDGAKISGPVAAFHHQMQQQHAQHPRRSSLRAGSGGASAYTSVGSSPSPNSLGNSMISTSSATGAGATAAGPGTPPLQSLQASAIGAAGGNASKDAINDAWLMHSQLSELRHLVSSQQKQIEQLSHANMQMQQQLLEQEELKAETMLLITQLMTRVSVLELHKNDQKDDDDDDAVDNDDHGSNASYRQRNGV